MGGSFQRQTFDNCFGASKEAGIVGMSGDANEVYKTFVGTVSASSKEIAVGCID